MISVTKQAARQFLLKKQLLYPPLALQGKDAIDKVFQTLRVIQFDPLNPCGRNTDLVLQSRIRDYHPEDYFEWLYKEKKGIECYDKELCIIPIADFPLTLHSHEHERANPRVKKFLRDYQKDIEALLKRIEEEGPISAADIEDRRKVTDGWSYPSLFGRQALDLMWRLGRLVIVKRERGRKYYDLPTRVYGGEHSFPEGQTFPIASEHVLRRITSVGMLPKSGSGSGWQGMGSAKENFEVIKTLLQQEKLVEVSVEGVKTPYIILREDERQISLSVRNDKDKRMVFIAPLDTLLWDRQMIEDLFGFQYRWEVYTPLPKRKYGYYVLPILYGDQFVGRIEPVLQKGTLVIKNVWKEWKWDQETEKAYTDAIKQFASYLNVKHVKTS